MTQIPLTQKGRRPIFFEENAADPLITMMLEIMAELWVVKERVYTLEKVLGDAGIAVKAGIETCKFSPEQATELANERRKLIETVMRSLETHSVDHANMQTEIDALTDAMKKGVV